MTLSAVKSVIFDVLQEQGIMIDPTDEDFDLREFIQDSLQFITFIVALEQQMEIEIYDELLQFDAITSFNNFSSNIYEIINDCLVD